MFLAVQITYIFNCLIHKNENKVEKIVLNYIFPNLSAYESCYFFPIATGKQDVCMANFLLHFVVHVIHAGILCM